MKSTMPIFDDNLTRFRLIKSNPGKVNYNWLFLPGGPGIDSDYLLQLVNNLDIEGNCWLIDFLYNGSNVSNQSGLEPLKIYRNWDAYFLTAIAKFENPILVGHSFGGFYPLFFPELENLLEGFVILSSVPTVPTPPTSGIEDFEKRTKEHDLPIGTETITAFLNNPSINTIKKRYLSVVPYAFPEHTTKQGIKLIENLIYNVDAGYWWLTEGAKKYTIINWIPEKIPLTIIGGSHDYLTPLTTFEQDLRFKRDNVEIISIPSAGHFPWIEQPALIKDAFSSFFERINVIL